MKNIKIAGFAQLRNELEKGNLENWLRCMQSVCDYVYIYDNASDDGSVEYYSKFKNTHVIKSDINRHACEKSDIFGKKELLKKLLFEQKDVDWIFWMDGDTILDNRMLNNNGELFRALLKKADDNRHNCVSLGHYNLWRNDLYYRIDTNFHTLNISGVNCLWKNTGSLYFEDKGGLHQDQFPLGMTSPWRSSIFGIEPSLIHRGFATDKQIFDKYNFYKSSGQCGADLDRLIYEEELQVEKLPNDILPQWFQVTDSVNPLEKKKLCDIYNISIGEFL